MPNRTVHTKKFDKPEMPDVPDMHNIIYGEAGVRTFNDTKVLGKRNWRNVSEEFYKLAPEVRI